MFKSEKYKRGIGFTQEIERLFDILVAEYTLDWLEAEGDNNIQKLWKRVDELSTDELHSLAWCIEKMLGVNRNWTITQIQHSKSVDSNHSKGAIFEIISLAMLNHPSHPVKTVKVTQTGYDGILDFGTDKELRVSIKNYGISDRQRDFEMYAAYLQIKIEELLKKYGYPPIQIIVDSPSEYPIRSDWFMLLNKLDDIFNELRYKEERFYALASESPTTFVYWTLMMGKLEANAGEFLHQDYKSYTLIVTGIYHRNEYRNIYSKLDKAYGNLVKHSSNEGNGYRNCLMIHMPVSVDMDQCLKWVEGYFKQYHDTQISLVILYQASVTRDITSGNYTLGHVVKAFEHNRIHDTWKPHVNLGFVKGLAADAAKQYIITINPDGSIDSLPIRNRYFYQKGKHYTKMKPDKDGNPTGTMLNFSGGIQTIPIIELPGQPGSIAITAKFAPSDDLLIL